METSTAALISLSRYTSIVRAIRGRVVKLTDAACKVTYVACLRCEYSLKILLPMARPTVPHRLPSSFGVLGGLGGSGDSKRAEPPIECRPDEAWMERGSLSARA